MTALHDTNYWEKYPELLIIEELRSLYEEDKSKKKESSSKTMWAIYYAYHPESIFYNLPNKLDILAKDFLKDPKFKWSSLKGQIDLYKQFVLSDAERALVEWNEIMVMRQNTLKDLYKQGLEVGIYEVDTKVLKDLDSMLTATPKMFDDYKKIKKDWEEEKVTKKGKKIESLSDTNEL